MNFVLHEITPKTERSSDWVTTTYYSLPPGEYIVIPMTLKEGQIDQFIIRVFVRHALSSVMLVHLSTQFSQAITYVWFFNSPLIFIYSNWCHFESPDYL